MCIQIGKQTKRWQWRCPVFFDLVNEALRSRFLGIVIFVWMLVLISMGIFGGGGALNSCQSARVLVNPPYICENPPQCAPKFNDFSSNWTQNLALTVVAFIFINLGNSKYHSPLWFQIGMPFTLAYVILNASDMKYCGHFDLSPSPDLAALISFANAQGWASFIKYLEAPVCMNVDQTAYTPPKDADGNFDVFAFQSLLICEERHLDLLLTSLLNLLSFVIMVSTLVPQIYFLAKAIVEWRDIQVRNWSILSAFAQPFKKLDKFQKWWLYKLYLDPSNAFHAHLMNSGYVPTIPMRLWISYLAVTIIEIVALTQFFELFDLDMPELRTLGYSTGLVSFILAQIVQLINLILFVKDVVAQSDILVHTIANVSNVPKLDPNVGVANEELSSLETSDGNDLSTNLIRSKSFQKSGSDQSFDELPFKSKYTGKFAFFAIDNSEDVTDAERQLYLTVHTVTGNEMDYPRYFPASYIGTMLLLFAIMWGMLFLLAFPGFMRTAATSFYHSAFFETTILFAIILSWRLARLIPGCHGCLYYHLQCPRLTICSDCYVLTSNVACSPVVAILRLLLAFPPLLCCFRYKLPGIDFTHTRYVNYVRLEAIKIVNQYSKFSDYYTKVGLVNHDSDDIDSNSINI